MEKFFVFYVFLSTCFQLISCYHHLKWNEGFQQTQPMKMTCYYSNGGMKNNTLQPEDINATLCTHILAGFASVSNCTLNLGDANQIKVYLKVIALKKKNPNLKVMLTSGGDFSGAVASRKNRTKFINSILEVMKTYYFDGIDIDWEFPAWNGSPAVDRINLIYFLKEFRQTAPRYILSMAVGAPKTIIDVSYDIPNIVKYVDFINLMSYDYHDYSILPFTGHNSPLFNRTIEKAYFATLNTAWSAQYWVQKGTPKSKLLVGIPTYTHSYKLAVAYMHGFDAPATGTGLGELTYGQVCAYLKKGFIRVFDEESKVPYCYKNLDWISYDDYESVTEKAKWIKKMGLGGAMTFDLNYDDWKGTCNGKTKFPLHQIIHGILLRK